MGCGSDLVVKSFYFCILRVKATGEKRKPRANNPSQSSSAAGREKAPEGFQFESIPSLTEVLDYEGLPLPQKLAPGERRILEELEMMDLVGRINTRQRTVRKARSGKRPAHE